MAQFNLKWINALVLGNANSSGQKALYRQKAVGGAWLENGFTPANPLATHISETKSPVLADNKIWEFKVQCNCVQGGPVDNDNNVQEQIKFVCINPSLEKTLDTATITLALAGTDVTKVRFTLRKVSDNSIVFGPYFGNRVADVATALASGLTPGTQYYWQAVLYSTVAGAEVNSAQGDQLGAVCGPYLVTTEAPLAQDLRWVADQTTCEKEGGFGLERTITGLSSPTRSWYDKTSGLIYIADNDSPKGNVYWFNPLTATSEADMTYSNVVDYRDLYNAWIDGEKRKIYFVGGNTGGLVVYDIDTNTKSTVAFGVNQAYSRITLAVGQDYIYCNDRSTSIVIINRHTLAVHATIATASLTHPEHFNLDTSFVPINDKIYVVNSNNLTSSAIGVYTADFSTHITEIDLQGSLPWVNSSYYQTGYYDKASNRLYAGDTGSSQRFVIDCATNTVLNRRTMGNKTGKSNIESSWTVNPITGELLYLYSALNTPSDANRVRRSYLEDRTTHTLLRMYENQAYSGLIHIEGTTRLVGIEGGGVSWNLTENWAIDGTIQILNNAIGIGNTGKKMVVTLKQVDYNNNNTPTGQTKNNIQGQADYIAPYVDATTCAITYTLDCPVDQVTTFSGGKLEWEFSIPSAVKNNPDIAKIQVFAYNLTSSSTEGVATEFTSPYDYHLFSGQFTGLAGSNYGIRIKYLNSSGVELKSC